LIRVNWKQGKIGDKLIRAHQVLSSQPSRCQFGKMNNFDQYSSVVSSEMAIKQRGYNKYKHCRWCWDDLKINPIP
jgi:hypothetical protein